MIEEVKKVKPEPTPVIIKPEPVVISFNEFFNPKENISTTSEKEDNEQGD